MLAKVWFGAPRGGKQWFSCCDGKPWLPVIRIYECLTSLSWSLRFFKEHGDKPVLVLDVDQIPPLTELLP